jgi:RNA 3'-terminal phosphate cyclase (ATP)
MLQPLKLMKRGAVVLKGMRVLVAHVPENIGRREAEATVQFLSELDWENSGSSVEIVESSGPGNVVSVFCAHENVAEMTINFGERGKAGKIVAKEAAKAMRDYLGTQAVVGRRLADQLLLPMALAGKGEFLTMVPSNHTRTNAELIAKFLDVEFLMEEMENGPWCVGLG